MDGKSAIHQFRQGGFYEFYYGQFFKHLCQKHEDADEMGTAPGEWRLFP